MFRRRPFQFLFTPALLILLITVFVAADSSAGDARSAWEAHVRDSLFSLAAEAMYPPEPTVQEILDNLGYNLDAENDAIELDLFCLSPQSNWKLIAEYSGAADGHAAGWYRSFYPSDTHTVITGGMVPGDSVVLEGISSDLHGLFLRRDAGTAWYTEINWNYDQKLHHKVYPLPGADGYIIFWEDLGWVTDGDYNDMVFEIRPQNLPPTISIDYYKQCTLCPPHLICEGDSVCLEIHVVDNGCFGDTVTVEMITGEGTFIPVTDFGDFHVVHCWLPIWEGSKYFVFRATDNLGLSVENEFWANVLFDHDPPVLPDPLAVGVTACLPELICVDFPITDTTYTDLWIDPDGYYDEAMQTVCFDADTAGVYVLWIFAADTCENVDSTVLTVTVEGSSPPTVTAVLDNYFEICGPESLCVGFSVFDPDDDIVSIWTDEPGIINLTDSTLCYVAAGPGLISLPIYVIDACGAADTAQVNFHVSGGGLLTLECPEPIDALICDDGIFCFPVSYTGGTGEVQITVLPEGFYSIDDGEACFPTNGSDSYEIMVIATDDCGADTCVVPVTITINSRPEAIILEAFNTFVCDEQNLICAPFNCSDADGNLLSCEFIEAPDGYYVGGIHNDEICFTAPTAGIYRVILEAADDCGAVGRDTLDIEVSFNSAPEITTLAQFTVGLCAADSVCFTVDIADIDGNLTEIILSENAVYHEAEGEVCFYAAMDGVYPIRIIAVDECGAADTADVEVTVTVNDLPEITCPDPVDTMLCEPGPICLPLPLAAYNGGLTITVEPIGTYNYQNEEICFDADTAGLYELLVTARDTCGGVDECTARIAVTLNRLPEITGESGRQIAQCLPTEVCIPVSCSDPDDNLVSCILVSGPGTYNGTEICFVPAQSGRVYFTVRATDECGASYELQLYVDVTLNENPIITGPNPIDTLLCDPATICARFTALDPEGGPLTFASSMGEVNPVDGTLCVYFDSDSVACVDVYAYDTCGAADTATICFNIKLNHPPEITVAAEMNFEICEPGEICFPVVLLETDGLIDALVKPYGQFNEDFTEVCLDVDTAGVYEITLIVVDSCMVADTAVTLITVGTNDPPVLTVPEDRQFFLCTIGQQVCVTGIFASDADDNLESVQLTSGVGVFNELAGELCFAPDTVGTYCFEITATDLCQTADVTTFCLTVYLGEPPEITLEPTIDVGIPEPGPVCFSVGSTDPDLGQLFDLEKTAGAGAFVTLTGRNTINAEHCFAADTAGCYEFVFESTDSCGLFDVETTVVCVTVTPPDTSFRICVDTLEVMNGREVDVDVIVYESMEMGGFDLLICFDQSMLSFMHAARGPAITDWEYFTYRATDPFGCTAPCDVRAIRFLSIADMNNGAVHPPEEAFTPIGVLATMTFYVTEDRNFIGQCAPFTFCSFDCGDNTVSSRTGDTLYVSSDGVDPDCLVGLKFDPLPAIEFCDGLICIIPPPDDRGDINLNGIANEVADAVLFTNYFIFGNSVWDPVYYENQWLATDVNDDGRTRTVADLVYLIRIITGDAEPFPNSGEGGRPTPVGAMALEARYEDGAMVLVSHSSVEIGGLFLRITGDFAKAGGPVFGEDVECISPKYHQTDTELRILFAEIEIGAAIPAGSVELLRLAAGPESIQIAEAEAATYSGAPLDVELAVVAGGVPHRFELLQNYPNPFNAGTTIRLAVPTASDYRVTIYNVIGRRVREFWGYAEPGIVQIHWNGQDYDSQPVASGIYFFRATAGEFTAARKMLLIK